MRLPEPLRRRWAYQLAAEFVSWLLGAERLVVVTHRNADPDAAGAAAGLADLAGLYGARETLIVFPEGPSRAVRMLYEEFRPRAPIVECAGVDCGAGCLVVVVDTANPAQLGDCRGLVFRASSRLAVIDHHATGSLKEAARLRMVEPRAASTSELVAALGWALDAPISGEAASLLYAGILVDTKWLRNPGVFSALALDYLVSLGADPEKVSSIVRGAWDKRDVSERIAVLKALSRMRLGRACSEILVAVSHVGSFEASAARAIIEAGGDVAVVFKDAKNSVRASIRVSKRALEAGVRADTIAEFIAEKYGGEGGGHPGAAAVEISGAGRSADQLAEDLARRLPGKVARLCMRGRRSGGPG